MSDVPVFQLPPRLARLDDLAYNLWWSWHPSARMLFQELDPHLWELTNQNPVLFLHRIAPDLLELAATEEAYLDHYDAVISQLDAEMDPSRRDTWLATHHPELIDRTVAYFSAEFGIHHALPIYSGGLGVLAGDHIKESSDLGLPMVAISLLYRQGYLSQQLTADGWQEDVAADLEPWSEPTTRVLNPDGTPLMVEVVFDQPNFPVRLAVWKVQVGRVPLYLLDADVDGNPEWTRTVSSRLYGGDLEHRLRQEIILGIGGVRALRALGIDPAYWHANEGHAALHLLERLREMASDGLPFEEAADRVRATTVFTSHTPVPAGHDIFPPETIDRYFAHYWPQLNLDRTGFLALGQHNASGDGFNLTALSLRLAEQRNGVSMRHGEITRLMWNDIWPELRPDEVPITSVTNGVHLPTWISPRMSALFDEHLDRAWRERQHEPEMWDDVRDIPDDVFWTAHGAAKRELFDLLRIRSRRRWVSGDYDPGQVVTAGPYLESDALTLGFARRFATYKRATLLFHDQDRLARLLNNPDRPMQIIFAGKAHPADEGGKRLIQEIFWRARDPRFGGRIAFAEDYDMGLAAHLVAGVDVWLNNPRAPLEASGTSGMKAGVNGAPNLSILDGWWREGWVSDNSNGWGIEPSPLDGVDQDAAEAEMLYEALESAVIPLYYDHDFDGLPHRWIGVAKESIRTVAPAFSARRMVIDYVERLYSRAADALTPV
jgi:starch phosphorylase